MILYLLAIFLSAGFGLFWSGLAILHERLWWKRRTWHRGRGVIVGHKELKDSDGCTYPAVIEYRFADEPRTFVSQYSSGRIPTMGLEVAVRISPDGLEGERDTLFNRFFATIICGIVGLICFLLAATVEPHPESFDEGGSRRSCEKCQPVNQASKRTKSPEHEAENEVGNVKRFLEKNR